MLKNLLQLYSLLICFISTLILIITTALVLQNISNIFFMEYKEKESLNKFISNEKYLEHKLQRFPKNKNYWTGMKTEELEKTRINEQQEFIGGIINDNIKSLINIGCWMISAIFFLVPHIYIYKKSSNVS